MLIYIVICVWASNIGFNELELKLSQSFIEKLLRYANLLEVKLVDLRLVKGEDVLRAEAE